MNSNIYLLDQLQHAVGKMALAWKDIPMLARTHGQPASPTRLGKEMMVFVERLENQIQLFSYIPLLQSLAVPPEILMHIMWLFQIQLDKICQ